MKTEVMNIHRALVELKLINDRITKEIGATKFVVANKHSNTKIKGVSVEDFSLDVRSRYQAITDLIRRRDAIKRAVTLSNAQKKVMVNGVEYTVAEAIEMKARGLNLIDQLKLRLTAQLSEAEKEADNENQDLLNYRADEYCRATFSATDMKSASKEVLNARETFIREQTMELVDPIRAREKIKLMDDFMDSFLAEVDSALSVSNATTEIEICY